MITKYIKQIELLTLDATLSMLVKLSYKQAREPIINKPHSTSI